MRRLLCKSNESSRPPDWILNDPMLRSVEARNMRKSQKPSRAPNWNRDVPMLRSFDARAVLNSSEALP